MPRLARSTFRVLEPNGAASSNASHAQLVATKRGVVYSGRISKRLTMRPSAPYSSTADVRRYAARSVFDQTTDARSVVGVSLAGPVTNSSSGGDIASI